MLITARQFRPVPDPTRPSCKLARYTANRNSHAPKTAYKYRRAGMTATAVCAGF